MDKSSAYDAPSEMFSLCDGSFPFPLSPLPERTSMYRRGSDLSVPSSVGSTRRSSWIDYPPPPNSPSAELVPIDLSWIRDSSHRATAGLYSDNDDEDDDVPEHLLARLNCEDEVAFQSSRRARRTGRVFDAFETASIQSSLSSSSSSSGDDGREHQPSLPELFAELRRALNPTIPDFIPDVDAIDVEDFQLMHDPFKSLEDVFRREIVDDDGESQARCLSFLYPVAEDYQSKTDGGAYIPALPRPRPLKKRPPVVGAGRGTTRIEKVSASPVKVSSRHFGAQHASTQGFREKTSGPTRPIFNSTTFDDAKTKSAHAQSHPLDMLPPTSCRVSSTSSVSEKDGKCGTYVLRPYVWPTSSPPSLHLLTCHRRPPNEPYLDPQSSYIPL
ncbi:hypothetical protein OF83DRAFT_289733 [Amylostereum chailletii]|nr:hypothetical protein OF83DRAFT_289733 [Amylostereum chailletii]